MPDPITVRAGDYVLDAHALIAFLEQEAGAELVSDLIESTTVGTNLYLSLINLGEIAYITERERSTEQAKQLVNDIQRLPLTFCQVSEDRVLAAAHFKPHNSVSYADAFAISLALELGAILVSGDPEILAVRQKLPILWVE